MTSSGGIGPPPAPRADPAAALRILLVEDSPDDAALLARALATAGLKADLQRVATAAQMQAALDGAEWDAILADHNLPSFSAPAALELLQAAGRDIPLLVVSGSIDEETAVHLMRAGAVDYISKDNLARLVPAVRREVRDAGIRRAQRAAEAQLRFQARLLDEVSQAIMATDAAGRIIYWNRHAERLFGWRAEEVLGRPVLEVTPAPESAAQAAEIMTALQRGESWQGEFLVRRRDGSTFPALVSDSPLFDADGQLTGLVGISTDISELKQREQRLEAVAQAAAALRHAGRREGLAAVVLAQAAGLLHGIGAALLLRPEGGGALRLHQASGRCADLDEAAWEALAAALDAALAQRPGPVALAADDLPPAAARLLAGAGECVLLAAPLAAQEAGLGALVAALPRRAGPAEAALLAALADMAANALHRAALFEQVALRAEQWAAVSALGRALAETLDADRIYALLRDAVRRLLPDVGGIFIARLDTRQTTFTCVLAEAGGEPLDPASLPPVPLEPPGAGAQSEAIHQRRPIIWHDRDARPAAPEDGGAAGGGPAAASGLCVPMLTRGQALGVLSVQSQAPRRFTLADGELLALAAGTAAVALSNAALFAEANRRLDQLQALHDIDLAISASLDVHVTLGVFLSHVTQQLGVEAAAVLLLNPHLQTLDYAAGRGFRRPDVRLRLRLGEGRAGRAALERRTLAAPDLGHQIARDPRAAFLAAEGFAAHVAAPLIAKGQVKGVLEVFHRAPLDPTPEWIGFLETLAGQAAIAVDQAELFTQLQQSNAELSVAYDATIEGWSRALDLRDHETEGHSQRVTELTLQLARAVGLPEEQLVHVRRGALLHDIGKMGVPDQILLKPGPLTDEEWVSMRQHPVHAYEMLLPIAYLRPALDIPYCHHEKWDGTGYPRGLAGEAIPLAARIFAVVDVWDALRSDRPYRPAWPGERVREHLRAISGTHLEARLVEAFLKLMDQA